MHEREEGVHELVELSEVGLRPGHKHGLVSEGGGRARGKVSIG